MPGYCSIVKAKSNPNMGAQMTSLLSAEPFALLVSTGIYGFTQGIL